MLAAEGPIALIQSAWALEKTGDYTTALDKSNQAGKLLASDDQTTGQLYEAVTLTRARLHAKLNQHSEVLDILTPTDFMQYTAAAYELSSISMERLGFFGLAEINMRSAISYMEMQPEIYNPETIAPRRLAEAYLIARSDTQGLAFERSTKQAKAALALLPDQIKANYDYLYPRILHLYDQQLEARELYLDMLSSAGTDTKQVLLTWIAEIEMAFDMPVLARISAGQALELSDADTVRWRYLSTIIATADYLLGAIGEARYWAIATQHTVITPDNEKNLIRAANDFLALAILPLEHTARTTLLQKDLLDFSESIKSFPSDLLLFDKIASDNMRMLNILLAERLESVGNNTLAAHHYELARNTLNIPNNQYARTAAGLARVADWSLFSRLAIAEQSVAVAKAELNRMPSRLQATQKARLKAYARVFETHIGLAWQELKTFLAIDYDVALAAEFAENTMVFKWADLLPQANGEVFYEYAANILEKVLASAQLARITDAGRAAAATTSRLAVDNDPRGALLRERDALIAKRELVARAGAAQRDEINKIDTLIDAIDVELNRKFPGFQDYIRPKQLSLAQINAALKDGEAMVLYFQGEAQLDIWFMTPTHILWHRSAVSATDLKSSVDKLRQQLDPTTAARSAVALEENIIQGKAFDLQTAYDMYHMLLAPFEPFAKDTDHLRVVADGALQSLPFSLLLTKPPPPNWRENEVDLTAVDWAIKRYAFTTLPMVSLLQKPAKQAVIAKGANSFAGIGNPVLSGVSTPYDITEAEHYGSVNPAVIRRLSPLPETAVELAQMNAIIANNAGELLLQENAKEPFVKDGRLANAQVITFATHGLMGGDLPGQTEPSLVLTPPDVASPLDDGLLSASEISKLTLSADWVILSACNTAAGQRAGDVEGLSGLARAFFYAGAQSLLVSHWQVQSNPTVALTTGIFKAAQENPKLGKAQALQTSILAMINTTNRPAYHHPSAWAAFVVVGR